MINTDWPYLILTRSEWRKHRGSDVVPLNHHEISELHGQMEHVSFEEIEHIYLPISRLLRFYFDGMKLLQSNTHYFLNQTVPKIPFILGISGSVAVGKSTASRILKALISRWAQKPHVEIITTDAFLYPNAILEQKKIMNRKGFPESYDVKSLLRVLRYLKSGITSFNIPIYSHHTYDICSKSKRCVAHPDVVIVEGLNILQTGLSCPYKGNPFFLSDYLDFSIFVDAETEVIKNWYIERVLNFCQGPFLNPSSYFNFLTHFQTDEVIRFAQNVWDTINAVNLKEHILPFKTRAHLIVKKIADHSIQEICLRR